MVGDKPIDPQKTYQVAVTDFIADGGDGYFLFKDKKSYRTGTPLRDLMVDTIRERGEIEAEIEGRIIRISE
jgi:2',3'-cyclic-nucleotide 2'-phosphodiesterase (5'-nucleotidase family)